MARELGDYLDERVRRDGDPADLMQAFRLTQDALAALMGDRQKKYGHGNVSRFGTSGVVIRATDKLERLTTMVFNGDDDVAESIEDSLGDLANYGVIGVLLQRDWWRLPYVDGD